MARERSPSANRQALEEVTRYVEQELMSFGYEVRRDPFRFEKESFFNLVAQRSPASASPLIVGAHIDAVEGSPGADDNASGVAVLLEVAGVLRDHPASQKVQFVVFNLEEWGMVGSHYYADRLEVSRAKLKGMISLEMLGFTSPSQSYPVGLAPFYPKEGNFIGVGANWRSRKLLQDFVRGMRKVPDIPVATITLPGNGKLIPEIRLSDHAPFWDAGYPALLVTDTSFYRNPHYHSASDTVETLDLAFLSRVAQGVLQGILEVVQ